jgi:hypothetical protein
VGLFFPVWGGKAPPPAAGAGWARAGWARLVCALWQPGWAVTLG